MIIFFNTYLDPILITYINNDYIFQVNVKILHFNQRKFDNFFYHICIKFPMSFAVELKCGDYNNGRVVNELGLPFANQFVHNPFFFRGRTP